VLALKTVGNHLVEGEAHPGELQLAHHVEDLVAFYQMALRKLS
jgi:hypothetical protein